MHSSGVPPLPLLLAETALAVLTALEEEVLPAPPAPPLPLSPDEDEFVAPLSPPEVLPALLQPSHASKPVPSSRHL